MNQLQFKLFIIYYHATKKQEETENRKQNEFIFNQLKDDNENKINFFLIDNKT